MINAVGGNLIVTGKTTIASANPAATAKLILSGSDNATLASATKFETFGQGIDIGANGVLDAKSGNPMIQVGTKAATGVVAVPGHITLLGGATIETAGTTGLTVVDLTVTPTDANGQSKIIVEGANNKITAVAAGGGIKAGTMDMEVKGDLDIDTNASLTVNRVEQTSGTVSGTDLTANGDYVISGGTIETNTLTIDGGGSLVAKGGFINVKTLTALGTDVVVDRNNATALEDANVANYAIKNGGEVVLESGTITAGASTVKVGTVAGGGVPATAGTFVLSKDGVLDLESNGINLAIVNNAGANPAIANLGGLVKVGGGVFNTPTTIASTNLKVTDATLGLGRALQESFNTNANNADGVLVGPTTNPNSELNVVLMTSTKGAATPIGKFANVDNYVTNADGSISGQLISMFGDYTIVDRVQLAPPATNANRVIAIDRVDYADHTDVGSNRVQLEKMGYNGGNASVGFMDNITMLASNGINALDSIIVDGYNPVGGPDSIDTEAGRLNIAGRLNAAVLNSLVYGEKRFIEYTWNDATLGRNDYCREPRAYGFQPVVYIWRVGLRKNTFGAGYRDSGKRTPPGENSVIC